jgi:hypothetical protein
MSLAAQKTVSWKQYDEACTELRDALDDQRRLHEENRYLEDFIHYKGIDEEFALFQKQAHEETDSDMPFPRLVMDPM